MSKVICEREDIVAIANAIRIKGNTTEEMTLGEIETAVYNIKSAGVDKIQRYIELNGGSAEYLFAYFTGESVDEFLAGVDTSKLTNAKNMFYNCSYLTTIPLFDTSNVTDMSYMFGNCKNLTTVPLFDTSKVKTMSYMFSSCGGLTEVPLFNTSNVTDMSYMFGNCKNLTTVPLFDTSNVTTMERMFISCEKLTTIPLLDTSKVKNFNMMVSSCYELTTVPLLDTRNATNMGYVFSSCFKLTTVPLLDTRNATTLSSIFNHCYKLTECWLRNIKTNLQVGNGNSWGHLLTLESLLHLCKECRKTTSSLTLTVGTANLEKLANVYVKLIDITDDMRAEDDLIDEKSPFVVCESTDADAMTIQDYMALKMWSLA